MIVRVKAEKAEEIAQQLKKIPNVETHGVHKEENIILVAEGRDVRQIENLVAYINQEFPDVAGVYPTYLNWDEDIQESEAAEA
jgi:nitrate reductase NapAB chaperone NapD